MAFHDDETDALSAMLEVDYDPSKVERNSTIPKGVYDCVVRSIRPQFTKAAIEANNPAIGTMAKVELVVEEGERRGAVIFDSIILRHTKPGAISMGQRKVSELTASAGCPTERNLARLVGAQVRASIDIREQDGFEPSNEIKRYLPRTGATPSTSSTSADKPAATTAKSPPSFLQRKKEG